LYVKETMSSYEIERERPDKKREARFVRLLQQAHRSGKLSKERLIELQNAIVDPRFANTDYRNFQNYVGETIGYSRVKVHYIPPPPKHLDELMEGLLQSYERMTQGALPPV